MRILIETEHKSKKFQDESYNAAQNKSFSVSNAEEAIEPFTSDVLVWIFYVWTAKIQTSYES